MVRWIKCKRMLGDNEMKSHGENTRIKLQDLAEGCLLVDTKERIWVVEDVIGHRIILSPSWGNAHYTKTINIGRKPWLYGFYLY